MTIKHRLFVDMDGVLAEWKKAEIFENLLRKGYFSSLKPYTSVVDAINIVIDSGEIDVFSLSATLIEAPHAIPEKLKWIDDNGVKIRKENRLFAIGNISKTEAVPEGVRATDILLDDYTCNLNKWSDNAIAIKLINGVNGTKGTWIGPMISRFATPEEIANYILRFA